MTIEISFSIKSIIKFNTLHGIKQSELLHYWLATTRNQRSGMCWQQFTVSPAGSVWLKDNVSMNFSIDTIPSSYVWSTLRTLEWPSQVSSSVRISLIQLNAIVTYCTEWHLRVISCLLFHCCICIQANVNFICHVSFQDHHPLVQHVLPHTTGSSTYEINY